MEFYLQGLGFFMTLRVTRVYRLKVVLFKSVCFVQEPTQKLTSDLKQRADYKPTHPPALRRSLPSSRGRGVSDTEGQDN